MQQSAWYIVDSQKSLHIPLLCFQLISSYSNCFGHKNDSLIVYFLQKDSIHIFYLKPILLILFFLFKSTHLRH